METIKTADYSYVLAIWLQAKAHERGHRLWPRVNASPICDAQCRWEACVACGL